MRRLNLSNLWNFPSAGGVYEGMIARHRRPRFRPGAPRFSARLLALAGALLLVGSVACSAVSSFRSSSPAPTAAPEAAQPRAAAVPAAVPAPGGAAAAVNVGAQSAPQPAAQPAPAQPASDSAARSTSVASASAGAAQSSASTVADTSAQVLDRMVIRTAQLTVEVQNMESALAQARAVASRAGGFVSASNTHVEKVDDQDRMVADLTLQVRSDSADSAMSDLRALGKVTNETSGSQDVTDEYVDLDSNLRNLQASETAILKLMDRATQIQDVLSLQRELTNVRGQIERIQGRKTYLERRTDMATITLSLRLPPVTPSQSTIGGAWDPLATALRGWQASLTVLRGVAEVAIVVLAFSWWLLPFIAVGAYVWLHRRRTPTVVTPVEST